MYYKATIRGWVILPSETGYYIVIACVSQCLSVIVRLLLFLISWFLNNSDIFECNN